MVGETGVDDVVVVVGSGVAVAVAVAVAAGELVGAAAVGDEDAALLTGRALKQPCGALCVCSVREAYGCCASLALPGRPHYVSDDAGESALDSVLLSVSYLVVV